MLNQNMIKCFMIFFYCSIRCCWNFQVNRVTIPYDMIQCGTQAFCVSQRFQPPGQASTYLKIKDREAWAVHSTDRVGEEICEKLPPPMDEVGGVY